MTDNEYLIYGLLKNPQDAPMNWSQLPAHINYKTQVKRLHGLEYLQKGELQKMEYYRDYNETTGEYEQLILAAYFEWIRDESGQLIKRPSFRRWVKFNGELGEPYYDEPKIYNKQKAQIADARRRDNIIKHLTSQSEIFGVLTYVQTMFRTLDNELNAYEKTGDPKLLEKIQSYSGAWLNTDVSSVIPDMPAGTTLRSVIISQLTL